MSRRLAVLRALLVVAAVSALAACTSPTAPTVKQDGTDACRSGYTVGQGVVCP